MRQILVPVDGSERSEAVLPWVAALAQATGARVVLFRAVGMGGELKEEMVQWQKGSPLLQVEEYLAGLAGGFRRQGIAAETAIGYRPEGKAILKAAAEKNVDLIAMCSRVRPAVARFMLGSTAREVFDGTDRPLLLIGSIHGSDRWRGAVLKKILVPLDGSPRALSVIPFVFEFARSLGASLALLQVVPAPHASEAGPSQTGAADPLTKTLQARANDFLTAVCERSHSEGVKATPFVTVGLPAEGIIRAAKETDADMIVLCSWGAGPRSHAGEVIESVLRSAEVPTLIVKPKEPQSGQAGAHWPLDRRSTVRVKETRNTVTKPLRRERKEMLPHVERLLLAADAVGDVSLNILWDLIDDAYGFLDHRVIPAMKAEDETLYPVVGRVMSADDATAAMSRDHLEVEKLSEELSHLRSQISVAVPSVVQAKELRRVLYSLYALLKVHFAKEEEIYLPLLDEWLTAEHADEIFQAMERAAERARHEPPSAQAAER
jgi:nucleotide-binding universal stress UspA family protein/iron-sulfur cluster repair protein YtfE (RIC family)